jgi:DNA-binding beta-propeller fold protein YncE
LPIVTTTAATSITATGAALNGTVNPNGGTASAAFEYSTNASLAPNGVTTFAGTGSAGRFSIPIGVALDPTTGDVFFADVINDTIGMITPAGVVSTIAGTAGQIGSTDGTGAAARFDNPQGVALDPSTGHLYVTDSGNDTIRMITPAGVVTTIAGTAGQDGSADGTGAAARVNRPEAIAFDPTNGDLFVADTDNDTIRRITPAGVVTTIAGTAGQSGSTDGTGAAARFFVPQGIAVDPTTGDVFVADSGNDTIRRITPAGVVTTLAGTAGIVGSADGTGAAASFNEPGGIAEDPTTGNLFVADGFNDTIRMITSAGMVTTLAGTAGQSGSTDGTGAAARFNGPADVAFNPTTDTMYVADENNATIRQLSVNTVAAQTGLTGTTAQAINASVAGLSPATKYYYRAVGSDSAGAATGSILSFTTAAISPTVTTQVATGVTANGATLNASVNPQGFATTVQFIYGTDPTLTTGTTTVPSTPLSAGSGTSAVPVNEPLTGLSPATTYYYRAVGSDSAGAATGSTRSFTTAAIPAPTVTTQAATGVTGTTATLNATFDAEGSATTVTFVYGTDPTLTAGTITTSALSIGGGTGAVAVSAVLSGLESGTTYYDRVVATSAAGATEGSILSFTTAAAPTSGPQVVGVQTLGSHQRWSTLVLTFSEPVNPASAQDLANYSLTVQGRHHPIRIKSAVLGSAGATVTLRPLGLQPVKSRYTLTVVGTPPDGLTDTEGDFLNGAEAGQAGTNYTTIVTRQNFVSPARKHPKATAAFRVSTTQPFPHGPAGLRHRPRKDQESGDRSRALVRAEIDPFDPDQPQ